MNPQTTTKPGTENKEGRLFRPVQAGTINYQIGWTRGGESGVEQDVYTSFVSAVRVAEMLQQSANDSPLSAQFCVRDNYGQVVYRCQA